MGCNVEMYVTELGWKGVDCGSGQVARLSADANEPSSSKNVQYERVLISP
jgi:hypothetical protein